MAGIKLELRTGNLIHHTEIRMRAATVLLLGVMAMGCGKKDGPPTGATTPPTKPDAGVVNSWKPHTAGALRFKANFPLGDPTIRPVFFGNQPKAVEEGWDYSVPVYGKQSGQDTYLFGIRAARFRAKPKPAERDETLGILVKALLPQGWTKSEPKTVTWAGQQATETTWSDPTKPTRMVVRQLVIDTGVYIGYVRDLGALPPAEMAKFFDGFELLAK
jgi:hypothetical protein